MRDLNTYSSFAKKLSYQYPFYGSGADKQDVYQVAMIAAWDVIRKESEIEPRFVYRLMRLRVIEFIRIRHNGQQRLERDTVPVLVERGGSDTTLETVLARDELERTVIAFKHLSKRQRAYLSGHLNGKPHGEIISGRKAATVDVMICRARKRITEELTA